METTSIHVAVRKHHAGVESWGRVATTDDVLSMPTAGQPDYVTTSIRKANKSSQPHQQRGAALSRPEHADSNHAKRYATLFLASSGFECSLQMRSSSVQ